MIEQNDEIIRILTRLADETTAPTQKVVTRTSAKLMAAVAYLQGNKKARQLSVRELAAQVKEPKCSKSIWALAKKEVS